MIRIVAALSGLFALVAPAGAAERRYSVTDFERVIVEGPYQVHLVVGPPSSAVVTGTREGIDRVAVDVQGTTLRIRRNRSAWGGAPGADAGPVRVELATRRLRSVRLVGPARAEVEGGEGLNIDLGVEGSGTLKATGIEADNLSLALLGSGRLEIGGVARRLRADFQGTGDVEGSALVSQDATIATNTVGTVSLTVNGPVTVNANGLGDVRILGRPVCTIRGMGASQVVCSNQR